MGCGGNENISKHHFFNEDILKSKLMFDLNWNQQLYMSTISKYPEFVAKQGDDIINYCIKLEMVFSDNQVANSMQTLLSNIKEKYPDSIRFFEVKNLETVGNKLNLQIVCSEDLRESIKSGAAILKKAEEEILYKKCHLNLTIGSIVEIEKILNSKSNPLAALCDGTDIDIKFTNDKNWLIKLFKYLKKDCSPSNPIINSETKNLFMLLDGVNNFEFKIKMKNGLTEPNKGPIKELYNGFNELFTELLGLLGRIGVKEILKKVMNIHVLFLLNPVIVIEINIFLPELIKAMENYTLTPKSEESPTKIQVKSLILT